MRTRSQARRRRQPQVRQTSVESSNLEKPDNPPIVTMADNRTMARKSAERHPPRVVACKSERSLSVKIRGGVVEATDAGCVRALSCADPTESVLKSIESKSLASYLRNEKQLILTRGDKGYAALLLITEARRVQPLLFNQSRNPILCPMLLLLVAQFLKHSIHFHQEENDERHFYGSWHPFGP
ncbi:hypothetical protein Tco_0578517 [Tanacetum coccineum]